jgi:hypothetical protein
VLAAVGLALRVLVAVVAAVIVGSVLVNLAAYARAAAHQGRHRTPCAVDDGDRPPWPARALAWLRAFGRECAATALLALAAPLALRRRRVPGSADGRRPVVLLHGALPLAADACWLARRLRADPSLRLYTVGHGAFPRDVARAAVRLGRAIDRIRRAAGAGEVDLVAHGRAGLAARRYIRTRGAQSGVARLVTLGTPHREAAPEARAPDPVPTLVDCTAIYSVDDAIVVPADRAYYPGAFNVELRGLGHTSLLFSRQVYEIVRENLLAPAAGTGATGDQPWASRR